MSGHGEVVFSGTWGHEESVNDPDTVRVFRSDDQPPFGLRLDICKHRTTDGWQVEAFMDADPLDGVPVTPENLRRMAGTGRPPHRTRPTRPSGDGRRMKPVELFKHVVAAREPPHSLLSDAEFEAQRPFIRWCRYHGGLSYGKTMDDFRRYEKEIMNG